MTPEQKKWIDAYKEETGVEPIIKKDDWIDGKISFRNFAYANINWWVESAREQMDRIEPLVPQEADHD